jgi:hypothetical protein
VVLKELERLGCVQFVIGSEKLLVSHFSPYEMADDMYRWAKQNFLLGDVETLQFIAEGEQTTPKESTPPSPRVPPPAQGNIAQSCGSPRKTEQGRPHRNRLRCRRQISAMIPHNPINSRTGLPLCNPSLFRLVLVVELGQLGSGGRVLRDG